MKTFYELIGRVVVALVALAGLAAVAITVKAIWVAFSIAWGALG